MTAPRTRRCRTTLQLAHQVRDSFRCHSVAADNAVRACDPLTIHDDLLLSPLADVRG